MSGNLFCEICKKKFPNEADLFKHNLTWEHRSKVEASSESNTKTSGSNPKTSNPIPKTSNPIPKTSNPIPNISNPIPKTSNPIPPPPLPLPTPPCSSFLPPLISLIGPPIRQGTLPPRIPLPPPGLPPHPPPSLFAGWPPPPLPSLSPKFPFWPPWSDEVRHPLTQQFTTNYLSFANDAAITTLATSLSAPPSTTQPHTTISTAAPVSSTVPAVGRTNVNSVSALTSTTSQSSRPPSASSVGVTTTASEVGDPVPGATPTGNRRKHRWSPKKKMKRIPKLTKSEKKGRVPGHDTSDGSSNGSTQQVGRVGSTDPSSSGVDTDKVSRPPADGQRWLRSTTSVFGQDPEGSVEGISKPSDDESRTGGDAPTSAPSSSKAHPQSDQNQTGQVNSTTNPKFSKKKKLKKQKKKCKQSTDPSNQGAEPSKGFKKKKFRKRKCIVHDKSPKFIPPEKPKRTGQGCMLEALDFLPLETRPEHSEIHRQKQSSVVREESMTSPSSSALDFIPLETPPELLDVNPHRQSREGQIERPNSVTLASTSSSSALNSVAQETHLEHSNVNPHQQSSTHTSTEERTSNSGSTAPSSGVPKVIAEEHINTIPHQQSSASTDDARKKNSKSASSTPSSSVLKSGAPPEHLDVNPHRQSREGRKERRLSNSVILPSTSLSSALNSLAQETRPEHSMSASSTPSSSEHKSESHPEHLNNNPRRHSREEGRKGSSKSGCGHPSGNVLKSDTREQHVEPRIHWQSREDVLNSETREQLLDPRIHWQSREEKRKEKPSTSVAPLSTPSCSGAGSVHDESELKLPPFKVGGTFGDVAETESNPEELGGAGLVPKGEPEEAEKKEVIDLSSVSDAIPQKMSSDTAGGSESTAEGARSEVTSRGPGPAPTTITQVPEDTSIRASPPPSLHVSHSAAEVSHGEATHSPLQSMLNDTLTKLLNRSVARAIKRSEQHPLSPEKSKAPSATASAISTSARPDQPKKSLVARKESSHRLKLPLISPEDISRSQQHGITVAQQPPQESNTDAALPTPVSGTDILSSSTLEALQQKLDYEMARLKSIELQVSNRADDALSLPTTSDAAPPPMSASQVPKPPTSKKRKTPTSKSVQQVKKGGPSVTQPAHQTNTSTDTSGNICSPIHSQSSLIEQAKSGHAPVPKSLLSPTTTDSSASDIVSKSSEGVMSEGVMEGVSEGVMEGVSEGVIGGTCASTGSGVGGDKKRKRRNSEEGGEGQEKKKRVEKKDPHKSKRRKTEKIFERPTLSGDMGRVSDPESMSVSSSQHNCSEEEVVVTSHMKFASDIAALDKRDKELQEMLLEAQSQVLATFQAIQESEGLLVELKQQQRELTEQRMELTEDYKKILIEKQNLFTSPSQKSGTQDSGEVSPLPDLDFFTKMKSLSEKEEEKQLKLLEGNQLLEKVSIWRSEEEEKLEKMKSEKLKSARNHLSELMNGYKEVQRQKQELLTPWNIPIPPPPPSVRGNSGEAQPLQLTSNQPMVMDKSAPDSSPHSSAMLPAEHEAVEEKSEKLVLSNPPPKPPLTHKRPPLDHAAYTHRLSYQFPRGSEVSVISTTPQYSGPPRSTLTPLSREEQLNYLPQSTTSTPGLVATPHDPQILTTVNTVTEEEASTHDHLAVVCTSNPPSTSDSSLTLEPTVPLSSLDKTTEDCVLNTVQDEGDNGDRGSVSIRQAWIAAQALSQTTDSDNCQVTGNEKTEVSMDISSHDEIIEEDRQTPQEVILEYSPSHENSVLKMKIFGNHLYTCSSDKSVKIYDIKSRQEVGRLNNHKKSVPCIEVFSYGDETYVVSGSIDKHIIMCNSKTGQVEIDFDLGARVMCMSIQGHLLVAGLSNGNVHLINLQTKSALGKSLVGEAPEKRDISCLCIHHNTLFTACYDNRVSCWDISDYTRSAVPIPNACIRKTCQIATFEKFVLSMEVGQDLLYCSSADTTVKIFSTKTWQPHGEVKGHNGPVSGICLSGHLLITSCFDHFIRLYDTKNLTLLQVYMIPDLPFTICSVNEMVYCGLKDGKVISIKIDLNQYHQCQWAKCGIKFGIKDHLRPHLQGEVALLIPYLLDIPSMKLEHFLSAEVWPVQCKWSDCHHSIPHDSLVSQHINTHVP